MGENTEMHLAAIFVPILFVVGVPVTEHETTTFASTTTQQIVTIDHTTTMRTQEGQFTEYTEGVDTTTINYTTLHHKIKTDAPDTSTQEPTTVFITRTRPW